MPVTEREDNDLMGAIARREPDAVVALYDRYGRLAFGLAYRILSDAQTAEEVVQDAFVRVWRQAGSFDPARGTVRAWLLTIVHRLAIDALRRRSGRSRESVDLEAVEYALVSPDVWGEVSQTLQREQVRQAVSTLPPDQRRAIELAYFEGLTHVEIAERLGIPLGTVKGRLRLGLRKLYDTLAVAGARGIDGSEG